MNLFFDEEAQQLIIDAKEEMYNLKHPYVGSEHLFLAILKNGDLDITKTLNSYNITYKLFYEELLRSIGKGNKSNDWFLFTPMLKRIITNAEYYATNNKITPYSLLVSIFQEGDGIANRILVCLKVDIMDIHEKFLNKFDSTRINKSDLLLDELAINLNKESLNNLEETILGREEEINNIIQILLRKNKNNPLLIGEAGVGKTAIVEEIARRIETNNVPLKLRNYTIYNLPISSLVAGTKYRGEFEERFQKVLKEVIDNKNIILFIDEIHTVIGAGGAEGAIDASNILKPFLARGELKVIGATTFSEYSKTIGKDKAFSRRFHNIVIEEPHKEEIEKILLNLRPIYENFHGVKISKNVIKLIIDTSNELLFYGKQPDKSIDLLDEVCSYSVFNSKKEKDINNLNLQIKSIINHKNREIKKHNFKQALELRNKENKLVSEFNNIIFPNNCKERVQIQKDDLYRILYRKTKIPIITRNYEEISNILGYNKNINQIITKIKRHNFLTCKKALSFLLLTNNKSLKIEKLVKKVISEDLILKLDLLDFYEEHHLKRIIGNNYDTSQELKFLDTIKNHPFLVIILSNIDKCHPTICNYLVNCINEGYFTDYKNNKYFISKSILFLTASKNNNSVGFLGSETNNKTNKYFGISNIIELNDELVIS